MIRGECYLSTTIVQRNTSIYIFFQKRDLSMRGMTIFVCILNELQDVVMTIPCPYILLKLGLYDNLKLSLKKDIPLGVAVLEWNKLQIC